MSRFRAFIVLSVLLVALVPTRAGATPVCTDGYKGGPPLLLCGGRVFPEASNTVDYVQYLPDPVTGFAEYQHGIEYLAERYPRWISVFTLSKHFRDKDAVSVGPDGIRSYEKKDTGDGHEILVIKITEKEDLLSTISVAERLQKILSAAGIASRRTAETLIAQGRVSVNGTVANYQALLNLANQDLSVQSNYDAVLEKLDIVVGMHSGDSGYQRYINEWDGLGVELLERRQEKQARKVARPVSPNATPSIRTCHRSKNANSTSLNRYSSVASTRLLPRNRS
mgnify:CR=1 FL=1